MAINVGFNVASDARAAAQDFIRQLNLQVAAVNHLSEAIQDFNKDGKLLTETVKVVTKDGEKLDVVMKQVGNTYELVSSKVDKATASLKRLQDQEKAAQALKRSQDATVAEANLRSLPGAKADSPAQAAAVEAAFARVRTAIEAGTVSLGRFQSIYAQLQNNPKAILPGLTGEETRVAAAIRDLQTGFKTAGDRAQEFGAKVNSSLAFVGRIFSSQVIGRITGFISSSLNEGFESAQKFSIKIAEIQTISQNASLTTQQWSEGIRRLSAEFGNNQLDVAEAAYEAISNQVVKGAEAFDFIRSASEFARAGVTSLANAVNLGSSAIKAYNLTAEDSDRIFASFFKTIELGRLRASDIANTFGRVATTAAQTGVSLDEVNAALATITVRGVPVDEAITLINNVMLKLIRPTDEMKKLLEEWGVASGSAAIATFGFSGVLQKLDEEAKKGSTRLGDLFNQIRAVRGAFSLSGNAFGDFTANLQEIQNAGDSYKNAAKIVSESFGQQLKVELNKIALFFSEEFGDKAIRSIVNISKDFGGLSETVKTLTNTTVQLVKVGVAYYTGLNIARLSIVGATAAQTVFNSSLLQTIPNLQSTKAATEALNASLFSVQGFASVFTLSFMISQFLELEKIFESSAEKAKRLKDEYEKIQKTASLSFAGRSASDIENQRIDESVQATRRAFDSRYQLALTYYSNEIKLSTELKNRATENLKAVTDRTKLMSKSYFDTLTENLRDLRKAANDAEKAIENSKKSVEGLERKTTDTIFSKRLGFASEGNIDDFSGLVVNEQKIGLIRQRIGELQNLARDKFKEGTEESIQDARKIYDEIRQQQAALLDAQVSKQRREFDEAVRRGQVAPSATSIDPITGQLKQRFDFVVKTNEFERQIQSTKNEQIAAEKELQRIQQQRLQTIKDQETSEKEKLRVVQQAFSNLEKISLLDKEGKIKDEFRSSKVTVPGLDGKNQTFIIPGALKALEQFDKEAARIREAAGAADIATQATLFKTLADQRAALEKQVNAVLVDDKLRTEQQKLEIAKKATQDQITFAQEKIREGNTGITEGLTGLKANVEKILRFDAGGRQETAGFNTIKAAIEAFSKDSSVENFQKLQKVFEQFKIDYQSFTEISKGKTVEDIGGETLQRFLDLQKAFDTLQAGRQTRGQGQFQLDDITNAGTKLSNTLQNIPNILGIMEQVVGNTSAAAVQNINDITFATNDLITNLQAAVAEMQRLNAGLPAAQRGAVAPNGMFGGPVKYLASGGPVGFSPRGSDTQPAMLDPREYIMTAAATQKFEPLLRALNSMSSEYSNSPSNVTNIGDINVSVSGGSTSSQTLRSIGKGLRREVLRKTIKLGR